jgi:predicted lipid-binding transport protein (Tim44 family)
VIVFLKSEEAMKVWSVILALVMVLSSQEVWAQKRMGGGLSFGKQSNNVTQRNAAPAQPAPAQGAQQNATQNAAQRPATAPAAAAAPKRPWGAMLGGLAAGLGLAWLASALGFGEGFAQFLLILLAVVAVLAVVGMVMRSRAAAQGGGRSPLAFQTPTPAADPVTARSYSPQNVGNDASARPWERGASTFGQVDSAPQGSLIGSALGGPQTWGVPADFDTEGFLRASKANFVKLQAAWDRGDIPALRAMMTDEMIVEIQSQLNDREAHGAGGTNQTEVVMLEAQLLGIEELDGEYMASVEFSGMLREEPSASPNPFREVWNITRPKSGQGGWLVAGVQALQ